MRANRYVSYLAAEIEPAALANARTFEREIEKTLDNIQRKSNQGSGGYANQALGTNVTRATSAMSAGATKARRDLDLLDASQIKVSRSAEVMGTAFSRSADALQIVQGPLGPLAGRMSALGQVLRSLSGFTLAGVLAGGGAFALGGIATQYQKMHDTLSPVITDQKELAQAMNDVIGIASRTHQALQPVAELYTQFSRVGKDAKLSQSQISRLTETVSKAAKIGGGDPEAQRGAIIQFGQALTANFHGSGQELQSILEQTPALAQAIANGLGTQTSKLKTLAKDGQLSTNLVVKALERSADEIDARFATMPPRIGKSLQDLENQLSIFVGKLDETTGATGDVAKSIDFVADHIKGLVAVAGTIAAAFAANTFAAGIKSAQDYAFRLSAIAPLTREQIATNELFKRSLQERAALEAQEAEAAVAGARAYQVQLQSQIQLIEKQIAAQTRAVEMARTLDTAMRTSGGTGSASVLTASYNDLNASQRALVLTEQQLGAVDAELAAAEDRLTAATTTLAAADADLAVAEDVAAAASGRFAAAKAVLQGAISRVQGAASGLVGFLGGTWGIAFTAAAGWAMYLASRTDYAKQAIDNFAGGEDALIAKLENTTGKMKDQAEAALALARALKQAQISKAQQQLQDVGGQAAADLNAAAHGVGSSRIAGISVRIPGTGGPDEQRLEALADKAKTATLNVNELKEALDILNRHPEAVRAGGEGLPGLLGVGGDSKKAVQSLTAIYAAQLQVAQAQQELADFDKRRNEKLGALVGNGSGPPTKEILNAQARVLAASDPLQKARAELTLAMDKGPNDGEDSDAYKQRIASLIQNVNSLVAARKAEKAATAEARKEEAAYKREQTAEERGRDNAAKLAGVLDAYSDDSPIKRINQLRDAAAKAKREVDDLVGERVGPTHIFTADEAAAAKAQIDAYEKAAEHAKPVFEALKQKQSDLNVTNLIAQGLGNQAEFVRRKVELEKQYGPLTADEEKTIRDQIGAENQLNDAIAKRQAIIENNARALDAIRDALQTSIAEALQGQVVNAAKSFPKALLAAAANAKATEIVTKLIGDPGKKYRDDMTRGLNDSAAKLSDSGSALQDAASDLADAAAAIANGGVAPGTPSLTGTNAGQKGPVTKSDIFLEQMTKFLSEMSPLVVASASSIKKVAAASTQEAQSTDAIVITAQRLSRSNQPQGITATLDKFGESLGEKIAGPSSVLTKVMGKLGTALEGAQTGQAASSVVGSIFGIKQSNTGAAIGGAVGAVAGSFIPGVGTILGGAIGGIIGGTIGGLFTPSKYASSTVSNSGSGVNVGTAQGHGQDQKVGAETLAGSVGDAISKIADQLGASVGNFRVSIGTDKHGAFVVDPTGAGRTSGSGVQNFSDQEAAMRQAVLDALQQGAVQGLRAGTERLLAAGKDLDAALAKAVKFEDVFKELKQLQDPVGAAIDDLNTQFKDLISIFTEAGASAEEWSQLQQLYDLKRADAIKQATQDTVSALTDFIQSMTSSSDSPLSRRTVYNNAAAAVDAFRSDINSGKVVDQDALVKALNDFEQASQTLFGSRSQFYSDFSDILSLAQKAKDNATGAQTSTNPLPPSPFDSLTPIAQQQLGATQNTNDLLTQIRDLLGSAGAGGGGGGGTIEGLPYFSQLAGLVSETGK